MQAFAYVLQGAALALPVSVFAESPAAPLAAAVAATPTHPTLTSRRFKWLGILIRMLTIPVAIVLLGAPLFFVG